MSRMTLVPGFVGVGHIYACTQKRCTGTHEQGCTDVTANSKL